MWVLCQPQCIPFNPSFHTEIQQLLKTDSLRLKVTFD